MPDRGTAVEKSSDAAGLSADQVKQVLDVSRMLAVTTDLDALLLRIAQAACAILGCERASIFLHDAPRNELVTRVALLAKEIRIPDSAGIAGHAFQQNLLLHVPRPYEDARFNSAPDRQTGFITRNLLTIPMSNVDHKPIGVLQAINKRDGDFAAEDKGLIQLVADQAGVAIQRYRLQMAAVEAVAMRREMDLARQVQQALIPKVLPKINNIEVAGWTRAASVTGGDCFDIWELTDGRLALLLADATGHGIAPALIVSQVRTLLRALSDLSGDAHDLMTLVNRRMAQDLDSGWFITAFLGILGSDGWLNWCSAGHGPIYLRTQKGHPQQTLEPYVPPLGVLPEMPNDRPDPVQLGTGGYIAVTSDGVFEARNPAAELFSTDRLAELLDCAGDVPAGQMLDKIRQGVDEFAKGVEPVDDQTILIARHK